MKLEIIGLTQVTEEAINTFVNSMDESELRHYGLESSDLPNLPEINMVSKLLMVMLSLEWQHGIACANSKIWLGRTREDLLPEIETMEMDGSMVYVRVVDWNDGNLRLSWNEWNSGGGCMIWSYDFPNGKSIHVTDEVIALAKVPSNEYWADCIEEANNPNIITWAMLEDVPDLQLYLTPHLGQELAEAVAADVHTINKSH